MTSGQPPPKVKVALLGAGMIGTDLLMKVRRSPLLECTLVASRDLKSDGLIRAAELGYAISGGGIDALAEASSSYDIVFDATNARSHRAHVARLAPLGKKVIDLTPSKAGHMVVPSINGDDAAHHADVNLITCGGQTAIPLLHALASRYPNPEYVEVVTTAASPGVGRHTRLNLDEYVETTQSAVAQFCGARHVKAMLNVSPAKPPPPFRVSISMVAPNADLAEVRQIVESTAKGIRTYCPGYQIASCAVLDKDLIFVASTVVGQGDFLPSYAGNLDIINAAAVIVAERHAWFPPASRMELSR